MPTQPKKTTRTARTTKENPLEELEEILTQEVEIPSDAPVSSQPTKKNQGSTLLADIFNDKHRRRVRNIIIGSIIAAVVIIGGALGSIYYYNAINPPSQENVTLEINGPDTVTVGEEVNYIIEYNNKGDVAINNTKLIIRESHGFQILKTEPSVTGRSWDLGTIQPGQHGAVSVTGAIVDNPEIEQSMIATLIFVPTNFNSEFTKEVTHAISLQPPTVVVDKTAPEVISLGEKFSIKLSLKNNNLYPLADLKMRVTYPTAFSVSSTDVAPLTGKNEWRFTNLAPASTTNVTIEGSFDPKTTFAADDERNQPFDIELLYPNKNGDYYPQTHTTFITKIIDQPLQAQLIINGSHDNKNINLGDTLNCSIIYKNKGTKAYTNASVRATILSKPDQLLDWTTIKDDEFGKIEKSDTARTITWTSQQIAGLAELKPGTEGTINFSIPIKKFADLTGVTVNDIGKQSITAHASLLLTDAAGTVLPSIDSSPVVININSNVNLNAVAHYYYTDGTEIGTGPLPPVAGQSTTYVIFWELTNDLHELENISITSTLPENVSWVNKKIVSSGDLTYSEATKEISWKLNRLPTSANKASVTFHVTLTPTDENIGKLMKLLNNTITTAHDTVTGDDLTLTTNVLTTNLDGDVFGIGKGVVIKP